MKSDNTDFQRVMDNIIPIRLNQANQDAKNNLNIDRIKSIHDWPQNVRKLIGSSKI